DIPLLVVMAFTSPFGFGIVLLGKEEEFERRLLLCKPQICLESLHFVEELENWGFAVDDSDIKLRDLVDDSD
nr:hypothetical protein [Tanacetum cinerariifolium]